jgi:twitching motility protein PilU
MDSTIHDLLQTFVQHNGTDLYLTVNSKPTMRGEDEIMQPISNFTLDSAMLRTMIVELIGQEGFQEFESTLEYNTAFNWQNKARFRINVFRQKQNNGMVLRRIRTNIPSLSELMLPKPYAELVMEKRGLVLIVGPTGAGKSTSMASMIRHRNERMDGHIVTVEDPVEFIHEHKRCIVTQRDVGIDTYSYGIALKNVLRQRPDVIAIGEIRDRDTMEHALMFSETGHLCLATLHAGNTAQALERIVNFFPEDKHKQVLLTLAVNLRGILSQRLIPNIRNVRSLACEIMLNQGLIRNLLQEGKFKDIAGMMEKSRDLGMCTFDQSLLDMINNGDIDEKIAYAESDNPASLRLQMTQRSMNNRLGHELRINPSQF